MVTKNSGKILALAISAALGSVSAQAADSELLDTLLKNGAINQTQFDELSNKEAATEKEETKNWTDDVKVSVGEKGLKVESADKQFKFQFGGRLQVEADGDVGDDELSKQATEGVEVRRARLYMSGVVWGDYEYMVEADFADNAVAIKDAFLTYTGIDWNNLEITAGHQKQPISMELQESSNDIMFTERSMVNVLTAPAFDRAIGLHAKTSDKDWSAQLGFYGDSMEPEKDGNVDEGWSFASRLTYAPINTKEQVVHLGTFGGYKEFSNSHSSVSFSSETTHMSNLKLTNVKITDVEGLGIFGVESAYMYGPFSIQGEYAHEWVTRSAGMNGLDLNAAYVQMAWSLTGEARSYKGSDGEFKYLKPSQNFSWSKGTWGAFELASRYGISDIAYGSYNNGTREQDVTVALNWYMNNNVRVMADYRYAFDLAGSSVTELNGSDLDHGVHSFTLRTQFKM
ncbi:MAG: OprO/OprP family phosphate-selective porin [Methylococcaceae bacterium]|nr:OprO/OprP family phosphate-selective porin [Methylococcaceae bacterium]